jgi:hypothetical protein
MVSAFKNRSSAFRYSSLREEDRGILRETRLARKGLSPSPWHSLIREEKSCKKSPVFVIPRLIAQMLR